MSRRGLPLPVNRIRVTGVPRGMRDFAIDTLRGLAAAGVLLSAVVHPDLWQQGFRDIHTIGPFFLLNVIAGLFIGMALLAAAALLWFAMRERAA
jgi:hypothetical protein